MDEWIDGLMDSLMETLMDELIDGLMDRWMDGSMDEYKHILCYNNDTECLHRDIIPINTCINGCHSNRTKTSIRGMINTRPSRNIIAMVPRIMCDESSKHLIVPSKNHL